MEVVHWKVTVRLLVLAHGDMEEPAQHIPATEKAATLPCHDRLRSWKL